MKTEDVIAALSGLDLDGVAMVAATCVGLIGQEPDDTLATLAFESAVRTVGGQDEASQTDLYAGGDAIYQTISSLDDGDFDFDEAADDESEEDEEAE